MSLLTVQNLKKSFAERLLFSDVTFEVDTHSKIGLIGINGSGKTTLLHILEGTEAFDEGNVYKNKNLCIGTLSQHVPDCDMTLYDFVLSVFDETLALETELERVNELLLHPENITDSLLKRQSELRERFEFNGGLTCRRRTFSTLLGLGFTEAEQQQSISTLSGGQKNKAQLARILLSDANLLFLDEPTNHLDIKSVEWLEDFLSSFNKAFIVISHDRYFLDKVTNKTIEMKNRRIKVTDGNYSRHMELSGTANEIAMRHFLRTQKEIKRIEGIVEQQRRWGQQHNFITAASKQKQADKLRESLVMPERSEAALKFNLKARELVANDVLIAEGLSKSFGDKKIFENVDLLIKNGEKVFLLGDNGCGKTTLIKILARKLFPDSGKFSFAPKVVTGYYDQNVNNVNEANNILEEIHDCYPSMNQGEIRNALGTFLFRGDDVFKSVAVTSGGERARIQLLKLMLSGTNLLFLDEPTNHLDIASREALENALEDYGGTMLIVTHDRYLVNRLADKVCCLEKDGITEYCGGYNDYIEELARRRSLEKETTAKQQTESKPVNDYKAKKELQYAITRANGDVKKMEKQISDAEAELAAIETKLASTQTTSDYKKTIELANAAQEKRTFIDICYDEWEKASDALNELLAQRE